MPHNEPFLSMMLHVFEASKMIRLHARIMINNHWNGRSIMGCFDETFTTNCMNEE